MIEVESPNTIDSVSSLRAKMRQLFCIAGLCLVFEPLPSLLLPRRPSAKISPCEKKIFSVKGRAARPARLWSAARWREEYKATDAAYHRRPPLYPAFVDVWRVFIYIVSRLFELS